MLNFLIFAIIPFPERKDNILAKYLSDASVYVSGTMGQYYDGKCHQTVPEHIIDSVQRKTDWCSNMNSSKTDFPWYSVSLKGRSMRISGYSVRAGCCYYGCCCLDDKNRVYGCCCDLYSWLLQGSNDNMTWVTIHKVEKDTDFYDCKNRTYDVNSADYYQYIRIIQDEAWPGCDLCICINKLELYGTTADKQFVDNEDTDDSISIIGKVRHSEE